jgi:hypothetical protein
LPHIRAVRAAARLGRQHVKRRAAHLHDDPRLGRPRPVPRKLRREPLGRLEPEHLAQRRAAEAGLDQQHAEFAELRERQRQVDRQRGRALAAPGAAAHHGARIAALDEPLPQQPKARRALRIALLPEHQPLIEGGARREPNETDPALFPLGHKRGDIAVRTRVFIGAVTHFSLSV